ncbi:MAG: aspartate-semialdehyde dehydrogenase [Bacteroidetes bacterium]|jgi:aspartate-semialdehyde dehydrogenase|nr:aspartate-semialdehyde dehydrogenase [Bacteroidota bacterium]
MKIAVVGATGLVGRQMISVLEERSVPCSELIPVASERSLGKTISFKGNPVPIVSLEQALLMSPDYALFSAGSALSLEYAERFAKQGCCVIDNSSAWRMDQNVPLVIPEVNGYVLNGHERIIANPNCSTIQLLVALAPIHRSFGIRRMVVVTFQSVSGAGKKGYDQWMGELKGNEQRPQAFPHPIHGNVIPQCDSFESDDFTKEEHKLIRESKKILNDYSILIAPTCTRVPVAVGHSESVTCELFRPFEIPQLLETFQKAPGITVFDNPEQNAYPMPLDVAGNDEVFVGRIRRDTTQTHGFHCWIVGDNLRKGAATNAVQILELMIKKES